MRYAIISDVHANLQAWRAVHRDIRSLRADYIICLGDVAGYGPSPAALLNEVHAAIDSFVLGNHDAVLGGRMDDASFTPEARELIRWTARRLDRKAAAFLGSFPLTLVGNGFRCAHGEFSRPASFEYALNPEDALPSWQANDAQLLFAGHTHYPAFFLLGSSGIPREAEPQDFELEPGKRYFINVGSVGYPRTGDPRATYCLYDTRANAVFWRHVSFDLDSFRTTFIQSGLSLSPSHFLQADPLAKSIPVRESMDFAPPTLPGREAQGSRESRDVTRLERGRNLWKTLFLGAMATLLIGAAVTAWYWPLRKSSRRPSISRRSQQESSSGAGHEKSVRTRSQRKSTPSTSPGKPGLCPPAPKQGPDGTTQGRPP